MRFDRRFRFMNVEIGLWGWLNLAGLLLALDDIEGAMMPNPVYLDNNATTRVAPEVLEAMLPFLTERWGNPSSAYLFGHELTQALEVAREQVAALLNAEP